MADFASPAQSMYWLIQGKILFAVLYLLSTACFAWIVHRRLVPLLRGAPDPRFDRPWERMGNVLQYWLGQWRHPRYPGAGALHILIFAGFLILAFRAFSLLIVGVSASFVMPDGPLYGIVRQYAATMVFVVVIAAALRRLILRPARY